MARLRGHPAPCLYIDGRRQTSSKTVSRQFVPAQYWRNKSTKRKFNYNNLFQHTGGQLYCLVRCCKRRCSSNDHFMGWSKPSKRRWSFYFSNACMVSSWISFDLTFTLIASYSFMGCQMIGIFLLSNYFFLTRWAGLLLIIMDVGVMFLQAGRTCKILPTKSAKTGYDAYQQLNIIYPANLYLCSV